MDQIYTPEVEEILLLHETVSEASVVGSESDEWGEEVVAFIVAEKGYQISSQVLDKHCLEHIARFKRLKDISKSASYPRIIMGKF